MRYLTNLGLLLICLGVAAQPAAAGQAGLRPKHEKLSVKSRIVARVPAETLTSIGLNHESFIFEVDSGLKQSAPQLVKVSYRFHLRDPQLPSSFMDYDLVHHFHVMRDDSCDESWGAISTRYLFDRGGNFRGSQNALVYTSNAPAPQVDRQVMLPCYVVTPNDYQSSEKHPVPKQVAVNSQSSNQPAVNPPSGRKASEKPAPAVSTDRIAAAK